MEDDEYENSDYNYVSEEELINKFEYNESYNIMNFYYDLKSRYNYFIDDMNFSDLLHFIIDNKFSLSCYGIDTDNYTSYQIQYFQDEYTNEINNTYYIFCNFIKIYKIKVNFEDWFSFCFDLTTIKKPTKY